MTTLPLTQSAPGVPPLRFDRLLETVRYEGAYPTRGQAAAAVGAVLEALGRQLPAAERAELAACLPDEAAAFLACPAAPAAPLTGREFVQDLAERTGARTASTRWDAGVVLSAVGRLAGTGVLDRVLAALPSGYALLFGRAELLPAAA
jgi:uncharacterized protein (DUF2267 family)